MKSAKRGPDQQKKSTAPNGRIPLKRFIIRKYTTLARSKATTSPVVYSHLDSCYFLPLLIKTRLMNRTVPWTLWFCPLICSVFLGTYGSLYGETRVQIRSPKDGSRIAQEENTLLVSGRVSTLGARATTVDLFFVLDVSGSTANYAGVDFGDSNPLVPSSPVGQGRPQIGIFGGGLAIGGPPVRDLKNSILAAAVAATRRLLAQLNPQATRVGLITFGNDAKLLQSLTYDFELVKQALDEVLTAGPRGGTNMVEGIRLAIRELAGKGHSGSRPDALKVQFLLTDGFPTLPIGRGKRPAVEDTDLAISAARIGGKAGIKIHVFALGEEAVSFPRAAVGIAKESGGVFTPVSRPADILRVLEELSVVGVDYVEVLNKTTGQKASQLRLAADGFFSAALPVAEGLNHLQVLARGSDGTVAQDSVAVHYQRGDQRSLELEIFLEKEKNLQLEIERLGKSREKIQKGDRSP